MSVDRRSHGWPWGDVILGPDPSLVRLFSMSACARAMSLDLRECCRDTACSELSLEPLSRMPSPLPAARCMTPPFAQLEHGTTRFVLQPSWGSQAPGELLRIIRRGEVPCTQGSPNLRKNIRKTYGI